MSTDFEQFAVDRFEGTTAVLISDAGEQIEVARSRLPEEVQPGTMLRVTRDDAGSIRWEDARIDESEKARRLAEGEVILNELRKRDPGGDIVL
jgi:Protein of unknown function (DUF3006)